MPESQKGLYNKACNPPRRVKRLASVTEPSIDNSPMSEAQPQPRPILPRRSGPMAKSLAPTTSSSSASCAPEFGSDAAPLVPAPSKRGRKPGPLSRAAREAQRRLNHSIIEKARRTKINEALATLKELVPAGYGAAKSSPAQEEDEDDEDGDDGEYQDAEKKARVKAKGTKKEEKEKEFKLEILIRTVSFMQDLLARVETLEKSVPQHCPNCADLGNNHNKKRKRASTEGGDGISDNQQSHISNRRRMSSVQDLVSPSPSLATHAPSSSLPTAQATFPDPAPTSSRLPSISSWLPDSVIDPSLVPAHLSPVNQKSHLPSPPASTPFDPVRMFAHPPRLSLGPVATAAMLSPSTSALVSPTIATMPSPNTTASLSPPDRTPEDENAASLLLQISASRSRSLSSPYKDGAPADDTGSEKPLYGPLGTYLEVQTPGSILGLNYVRRGRL